MKGIGKRAYSDLSCEHNACSKKGFSKKMRWEHDEVPSTLVSGSYNNPFSECRAPTTKVIVDPLIKSVYRFVDKKTYLDWGLTSDWHVSGPRNRVSVQHYLKPPQPSSNISKAAPSSQSGDEIDNSASEGYGEMTEGSIERLFCFLARIDGKDSPASFKVSTPQKNPERRSTDIPTSESPSAESQANSFIDIGSGYGKVVFHAKLGGKYSHSVGIEYVESRAALAASIRDELLLRRNNLLSTQARELLRSCVLFHADATKWECFNYSHVYMYDRVFNESTLSALAKRLNVSFFKFLVTYRRVEEWTRLGLRNIKLLSSITMRTTGGQNFRAYVLCRKLPE